MPEVDFYLTFSSFTTRCRSSSDHSLAASVSILSCVILVYTGSSSSVDFLGTFYDLVVVELDVADTVLSHSLDYHALKVNG